MGMLTQCTKIDCAVVPDPECGIACTLLERAVPLQYLAERPWSE